MDVNANSNSSKPGILPVKSHRHYKKSYDSFMTWRSENNISSFSEDILLKYYKNLDAKFKPSTLWTDYSKLKSTLMLYNQVDISKYKTLTDFLKKKNDGFEKKKAKTFTLEELEKFIIEASDQVFLHIKVVVIFGIMGACRRQELHDLKVKDVIDTQNILTVRIMNSKKNQIDRKFAIGGPYYKICKKYMDLRPIKAEINKYFFLRYFNGRCADQNIGINAFGAMGKVVAKELKLPSPELYTGHCFKRTSVNLLGTEDIRLVKMSWQLTSENKTLKTERDYSLSGKLQTEPTAPLIAAPPSPGPSQSTTDALDSDASTEYLEEPQDHVTPQRQVFSVSKASTKPQDPLKQDTKQCRFCGKYSEDCVPISPTHLASVTTKLAFNDIVVQFSESLPKTVCKDCDVKLQVIYDFVQYAKAAQELLIDVEDGEEVVEVKHEYEEDDETDDSLQEDNDSDEERKEQIVDLITAGETVFTKENKKRKSNAIRVAKPKKTKVAKSESGNEEVIDRDDTDDEADNIGFSNSDTRTNKPCDAKFAKRVFVRKVRIDGNS